MIKTNENYDRLNSSYLFFEVKERLRKFQENNKDAHIIKLGIGDVTMPLAPAIVQGFHHGVEEMADIDTFRGYGPYEGYDFLREKISENDYGLRSVDIKPDEIFISDGAKGDTSNFQEVFSTDTKVAIPDPVFPVYLDTNVMAGRTGEFRNGRYDGVVYLDCTRENNFLPGLPGEDVDLIYLCFPNNPTGTTATKQDLEKWVAYAREKSALILFDAAYESFIRDENLPRTIYEIKGAKEVAVEFRSFSKTAGFTGARCGFTVVPKACMATNASGRKVSLHNLWKRRCTTKCNGVSFPVQRAAEAVYSPEGKQQVKDQIDTYLNNALIISEAMDAMGLDHVGGKHSPYVWVECQGYDSWQFFDLLLNEASVVVTPGEGFGKCGRNYVRISAFNTRDNVEAAMKRIKTVIG